LYSNCRAETKKLPEVANEIDSKVIL
jgi:hypothetical protein